MKSPSLRERPACAALIGVCLLAFVAMLVVVGVRSEQPLVALFESLWKIEDVEALRRFGGLEAARVWIDKELWRVATAGFLHGSWLHLGLNMMGLWTVGQWIEKAWGPWRMLGVFAASNLIGCLASLAWAEAPMVVGASAGIFGLAGALVVGRAWGSEATRQLVGPVSAKSLGGWLLFWLVVGFVLPLVGVRILAHAGHIGGLLAGGALGWCLSRGEGQRLPEWAGWIGASVLTAGLGVASLAPTWRPNYDVFMGFELLEREAFAEASEHFDRALEREPDDPSLANAVAYALAEAGSDLERAEVLVRRALEMEPGTPEFIDTLGWIQCKLGQTEAGLETLREADTLSEGEIEEIGAHILECAEVGRST